MSWVKSGTFITPASGTTVIDITDKGTAPKVILLWGTWANADDVNRANAEQWWGASDGVNHRALMANSESNAVINTQRNNSNVACLLIEDPADDSIDVLGTAVMNANDVTLSYSTFTAGFVVHYEIYGGADCQAAVFDFAANTSPVTGVGFQPTLVGLMTAGNAIPGASIHAYQSFGMAADNGVSIDQWALLSYFGDNDLDAIGSALVEGIVAGQYDVDFANWTINITSIDADGFTWAGTNADDVICVCIDTGANAVDVGVFTKATGAAPVDQDLPDLGFVPQFYHLSTSSEVLQTIDVNRDARVSHGAFDGGAGHSTITTRDNVSGTDAHSRSNVAEVLQTSQNLNVDGVQASATPAAIVDSSPTINWNPNTATADVIGYYAVEEELIREQEGFQWREDDDDEANATNIGAQDSDLTAPVGVSKRLRSLTNYTGNPPAEAITREERRVGDADSEWRSVI